MLCGSERMRTAIWMLCCPFGTRSSRRESPFRRRSRLRRKPGAAQSYTGVAEDEDGQVVGIYILHPNNVGRCGHIANASYAVRASCRGRHIGEKLVTDCLAKAREIGFRVLQFNAVVESNRPARHLFVQLGVIPGGFRRKDGRYENICPYYRVL